MRMFRIKLWIVFGKLIDRLEGNLLSGMSDMPYFSKKYRVANLWKQGVIFRIYEAEKCVKIDYVIDDRQNYVRFIH